VNCSEDASCTTAVSQGRRPFPYIPPNVGCGFDHHQLKRVRRQRYFLGFLDIALKHQGNPRRAVVEALGPRPLASAAGKLHILEATAYRILRQLAVSFGRQSVYDRLSSKVDCGVD
jgi:hypothetical protein